MKFEFSKKKSQILNLMKIRRLGDELCRLSFSQFCEGAPSFLVCSADSNSRQSLFVTDCLTVAVTSSLHVGPLKRSLATAAETPQIFVHFAVFRTLTLRHKCRLMFTLMQSFNGSDVLWHRSVWQIVVRVVKLNTACIFMVEWRMTAAAAHSAVVVHSAQQHILLLLCTAHSSTFCCYCAQQHAAVGHTALRGKQIYDIKYMERAN